jgi:hypothetical protein
MPSYVVVEYSLISLVYEKVRVSNPYYTPSPDWVGRHFRL